MDQNPYESPVEASADPAPEQGIRAGAVARDVVMVMLLTMVGGFIVGFAMAGVQDDAPQLLLGIALQILCFRSSDSRSVVA